MSEPSFAANNKKFRNLFCSYHNKFYVLVWFVQAARATVCSFTLALAHARGVNSLI